VTGTGEGDGGGGGGVTVSLPQAGSHAASRIAHRAGEVRVRVRTTAALVIDASLLLP